MKFRVRGSISKEFSGYDAETEAMLTKAGRILRAEADTRISRER